MAIPFLNNINLSDNQLLNAKLQVTGSAPTAAAGQIYFNSTDSVAKYHNGTAWVDIPRQISVGGTSLADSQAIDLVAGANVGIAESSGTITISSSDQFTGTVTSVGASTAGDALDVAVTNATTTPDLAFTWAGAASQYIDGAGNLTTFPTIPTVPSNIVETIITTNGAFIDLTPATATDGNVTITADLSAGGTPSTTTYLRGDNSWEPISAIPGTYTWTLAGDNGGPTSIPSATAVTIVGGDDLETTLVGTDLTVDLKVGPGDVGTSDNYVLNQGIAVADADDSIPFNSYTPGGNPPSTQVNVVKKTTLGTIPVTALTLVKTYIDESVTGLLQFIGGFDANTGDLDSPLTTDLYTNTALAVGDLYVVSTAGNFFGNVATPLTPGDSVIVQTAAAAGAAVEGDFIVVQSDTDLATLATVGIGNVNIDGAGNKDGLSLAYASGTATVGLDITNLPNLSVTLAAADLANLEIPLYNGDTSDANEKIEVATLLSAASSQISHATTITDTATISHGLSSSDVMVQLYDITTGETVYADVDRISTTQVTITFASTPTNSVRVLVQKIG